MAIVGSACRFGRLDKSTAVDRSVVPLESESDGNVQRHIQKELVYPTTDHSFSMIQIQWHFPEIAGMVECAVSFVSTVCICVRKKRILGHPDLLTGSRAALYVVDKEGSSSIFLRPILRLVSASDVRCWRLCVAVWLIALLLRSYVGSTSYRGPNGP